MVLNRSQRSSDMDDQDEFTSMIVHNKPVSFLCPQKLNIIYVFQNSSRR